MLIKILNPKISIAKIDISLLLLRIVSAMLMIPHGYNKLIHFSEKSTDFMSFMGMGSKLSYSLLVGAEFFCAILLLIGLFSRLALVPLVVTMFVAVFKAHSGDIFGDGETAFFYFTCYLVLLITGPGKWSLDNLLFGQKS